MLEEMAVSSTDVPIEVIQARRSMDYAIQYSMSSSKFLRKIYYRQGQYQKLLSKVVTKIYNYQYDKNEKLEVILPPPMFLNMTNTNQIITNTNELIENIVSMEYEAEPDANIVSTYKRNLKRYYFGTYLNIDMLDQIKNKSRLEAEKLKLNSASEEV